MKDELREVARRFGTPGYVYFMDGVRQRIDELDTAFGDRFSLSYAVKSNPNPGLLRWLSRTVPFVDISSGGELTKVVAAGWSPERISFTGPGKRPFELQAAVEHSVGEVVVESVAEALELNLIAGAAGKQQRILVRIAPKWAPMGFGDHMAGRPCPFGVDEEALEPSLATIRDQPNLDLRGFHIYSGSQCLDAAAIVENYRNFLAVFRTASALCDLAPEKLIFGSGLGVPYHDNQSAINLEAVAKPFRADLDAFQQEAAFARTSFVLELGRYLVGEAGIYLLSVVHNKESRGTHICICDGGMNHHLAACGHMGMVIPRNYRFLKVSEDAPGDAEQDYQLVGPLCTSLDTLGRNVRFRGLRPGDVVGVHCSGAYGVSSSPIHFISHQPPYEVMVETRNGETVYDDVSQFTTYGHPASP
jgi:diaminopimelate decarboxylase